MADFRTIEIDLDVHKLIEAERRNFAESDNDALRRLLRIDVSAAGGTTPPTRRSWKGSGVELPHETSLRMTYNGVTHTGKIEDGVWLVAGERFSSPSGAASSVGRTKAGSKTRLDGWKYWEAKTPGTEKWISIYALWKGAEAIRKAG